MTLSRELGLFIQSVSGPVDLDRFKVTCVSLLVFAYPDRSTNSVPS